jgi:hypothetical protein
MEFNLNDTSYFKINEAFGLVFYTRIHTNFHELEVNSNYPLISEKISF